MDSAKILQYCYAGPSHPDCCNPVSVEDVLATDDKGPQKVQRTTLDEEVSRWRCRSYHVCISEVIKLPIDL